MVLLGPLFMPQGLNPGASILETQQWLHRHRFSSYCRLLASFTGEAGIWSTGSDQTCRGLRALRQEACLSWLALCPSTNFYLELIVEKAQCLLGSLLVHYLIQFIHYP